MSQQQDSVSTPLLPTDLHLMSWYLKYAGKGSAPEPSVTCIFDNLRKDVARWYCSFAEVSHESRLYDFIDSRLALLCCKLEVKHNNEKQRIVISSSLGSELAWDAFTSGVKPPEDLITDISEEHLTVDNLRKFIPEDFGPFNTAGTQSMTSVSSALIMACIYAERIGAEQVAKFAKKGQNSFFALLAALVHLAYNLIEDFDVAPSSIARLFRLDLGAFVKLESSILGVLGFRLHVTDTEVVSFLKENSPYLAIRDYQRGHKRTLEPWEYQDGSTSGDSAQEHL